MFSKAKLATAILAVLSSTVVLPAFAQAEEDNTETILVKGIRSSLAKAIDRKKESNDIIDSIVAEDIGKFPDANVAESLQRISGVSISRSGGEGQQVTVRGFGPQFNTVLVNGRRIASDSAGRGFNFALLPADLIGGADVYKSSSAELQEGGIGSTINLRTQRPLDIGKFSAVASARGVYDEQSGEAAPQVFGLITNTFADDTIGLLFSASYQGRNTANDQVEGANYLTRTYDADRRAVLFENGLGNEDVDSYTHQQQTQYIRAEEDRERFGVTGAFQFMPADNMKLTVDGLYSAFEVKAQSIAAVQFNEIPTFHNAIADENNILTRYDQIGRPFSTFLASNRDSDLFQVGTEFDWDITESLSAKFDWSNSRAKDDNAGKNYFVVVAGEPAIQRYDNTAGLPAPVITNYNFTPNATDTNGDGVVNQFDYTLGSEITQPDPTKQSSWFSQREGDGDEDHINELKADFEWFSDSEYLRSVSFGAYYGQQEKTHSDAHSDAANVVYLNRIIPLPESLLSLKNRDGYLDAVSGNYPSSVITYNVEEVLAYLEDPATLAIRDNLYDLPAGTSAAELGPNGFDAIIDKGRGYSVEEDITSLYINAEFATDIDDMELTVNTGLRYSETDTTSTGFATTFTDFTPNASRNDVLAVTRSDAVEISQKSKYDNWLPNINAKLRVNETLILRTSYSETLTRPNLGDLNPGVQTPQEVRLSDLRGSGGNPELEPYTSTNFDVSSEFYINDSTLFSLGLFHKKIEGYIVRGEAREAITLPEPNSLGTITEDRTNVEGNQIFFTITRPRNLESTKVYGAEISFQHTFEYLPGLLKYVGINANLTYVNSTDEFDTSDADNSVVLPGLSNSQNLVLFYDDDTFEARLAYNKRQKYFDRLTGIEPIFVDQYDQLDARIAWNIEENIQVFAEGTNLTNSYTSSGGRFDSRFGLLESPGARYAIGVRASF